MDELFDDIVDDGASSSEEEVEVEVAKPKPKAASKPAVAATKAANAAKSEKADAEEVRAFAAPRLPHRARSPLTQSPPPSFHRVRLLPPRPRPAGMTAGMTRPARRMTRRSRLILRRHRS